jgi:hypothetical protein
MRIYIIFDFYKLNIEKIAIRLFLFIQDCSFTRLILFKAKHAHCSAVKAYYFYLFRKWKVKSLIVGTMLCAWIRVR